ncbi:hypothetical protein ACFSKN_04740 [Mariniflexile gromovii]|uniref:Uncharacterized protein n=1 Tax=Mariniflexile gromovii TaxID=362523 RepID=A0ABS4BW79_9FLAO|nr:hypothetical protein [Mariniflexile gromovii]MBP0904845.1 hypothetical protein [Mariniflexile gromovii]
MSEEKELKFSKNEKVRVWMLKMKEVLQDENTTLLSDKDIFYLVNDLVGKNFRISMSYFEFLKSPNQDNKRSISNLQYLTDEEKEDFINTLNVGRVKQKMNLTAKAFDDDKKNAYPYLWALERKNSHLQLKQNHLSIGNGNITLQIEGSDKNIIDLVDIDYEEVQEEKLLITKKGKDDDISETNSSI